ncbi:MAG: class I SAM-dependent methyltransferase, partial [Treponema sp.]|nr:class I SAM-dependent methyltransferase [Treponema sp.]
MKRIILKPGEENRILAGHPWVYDNEVAQILEGSGAGARPANLEPGEPANVESSRKRYLGRAFVNPQSKIIARIYSPSKEGVDKGFFKRRIREALGRRAMSPGLLPAEPGTERTAAGDTPQDSGRLLFGEADFLPGLIIDRFRGWPLADIEAAVCELPLTFAAVQDKLGPPSSWLSLQFLIYGIDCRQEEILAALEEALEPQAGIYEKSGARVRELEGLPLREGVLRGAFPAGGIVIFENGLPFLVDPAEGQKTGHFFDQKENRLWAACFGRSLFDERGTGDSPARILDACSYTGGFAIHLVRLSAVWGSNVRAAAVDVSAAALETLKKNARLNRIADRIETAEADVFEDLRLRDQRKEKFDMVILDPPAFAKSRSALGEALKGYREINYRALRLL